MLPSIKKPRHTRNVVFLNNLGGREGPLWGTNARQHWAKPAGASFPAARYGYKLHVYTKIWPGAWSTTTEIKHFSKESLLTTPRVK